MLLHHSLHGPLARQSFTPLLKQPAVHGLRTQHRARTQRPSLRLRSQREEGVPVSPTELVRQSAQEAEQGRVPAVPPAPPGVGGILPPGAILGKSSGRSYTIGDVLGTGSNAVAYRATTEDGRRVAIKSLSFKGLRDWKQLELFQREARTLASLDHPGIPRYIDYFEEDNEYDRCFCIVQEEAVGKSLGTMVMEGMRCTDAEATRIALELLRILSYLSSLRPPVIHRDVKPENIILEGGRWGGRVFLVDFGGVQGTALSAMEPSSLGSTVIGTYGYMAPEQFRGAAQPASDLYAAGSTLLFLLSGRPPSAFPQERMRIRWRGSSDTPGLQPPSPQWAAVLDGLLEPLAEDRLTASQAIDVLEGREDMRLTRQQANNFASTSARGAQQDSRIAGGWAGRKQGQGIVKKPAGTRVQLERTSSRIDITIPPKGLSLDSIPTGIFAITWNAFVASWTISALAGGGILFALFSAPFWWAGATLLRRFFGGALVKERVAIGRQKFRIGQELAILRDGSADFLGGENARVIEGQTGDVQGARIVTSIVVNGVPQTAIEVLEGTRKHRFGEGLECVEQQWLVQEINEHLSQLGSLDYDSMPPPEEPAVYNDLGA